MIIGITGLIGSGKTTISKIFQTCLGCNIYDCDAICQEIIARDDFKQVFGFSLNIEDINAKKKFISNFIFNDNEKRSDYEKYIWRKCAGDFLNFASSEQEKSNKYIILDAPLLFQAEFDKYVDKIVLVQAERRVRAERFTSRGGSKQDFAIRDKLQSEYFRKNEKYILGKVDKIIVNENKTLQDIKCEIENNIDFA